MKEQAFKDWLIASGYKDKVISTRISNVRRIEDHYPDLDSRIEDGTIKNLLSVFNYSKADQLKGRIPLHQIHIDGDMYNGTNTLRNALTLYLKFFNETHPSIDSPARITSEDQGNKDYRNKENIYKGIEFYNWLQETERLSKGSASSYISYLNSINKEFKVKDNDNKVGKNLFATLTEYMENDDTAKAIGLLEDIEYSVSLAINSDNIEIKRKKKLTDFRSGLRKYTLFLTDNIEDLPDEDELNDIEYKLSIANMSDKPTISSNTTESYNYEMLERNFRFRLLTQNRMSENKDVFYPISILRRLFHYSQQQSLYNGNSNYDYKWFNDWANESIAKINIITNHETLPFSQIEFLLINPYDKSVKVIKNNDEGTEHIVFTETNKEVDKTQPMIIKQLRDIHIDHTPPVG